MADDLINSREAGRLLGKTRQWVAELCRRGLLKCTRVGRDWVISRQSVLDYRDRPLEQKKSGMD